MIRINLLAADRPAKKASGGGGVSAPSAPGAVQLYLFLALFVGGAIAVCGGMYFLIMNDIATLDKRIADAKAEEQRLMVIKKQIEEFQRKKKLYEEKVRLIERLRDEQSGPVHMLDELSKALPDFLWLTNMDERSKTLVIKGEATGMTSVAEFIASLQRSGWFPAADLKTYNVATANNLVTFEVSATFQDPAIAAKQKAAAEAAAKAAAAAPPPAAPGAPGAAPARR